MANMSNNVKVSLTFTLKGGPSMTEIAAVAGKLEIGVKALADAVGIKPDNITRDEKIIREKAE